MRAVTLLAVFALGLPMTAGAQDQCISIQDNPMPGTSSRYVQLKNTCSGRLVYVACWKRNGKGICSEPSLLEAGQTKGYGGADSRSEAQARTCPYGDISCIERLREFTRTQTASSR